MSERISSVSKRSVSVTGSPRSARRTRRRAPRVSPRRTTAAISDKRGIGVGKEDRGVAEGAGSVFGRSSVFFSEDLRTVGRKERDRERMARVWRFVQTAIRRSPFGSRLIAAGETARSGATDSSRSRFHLVARVRVILPSAGVADRHKDSSVGEFDGARLLVHDSVGVRRFLALAPMASAVV